ncbi:hypothetical protein CTA1_3937 [Colletotrichum tanaceti]|uniref:Uncharacterized protein n=1 Tax=Colletotrichum tanaceti TaxID=1306861 RepID=A0A4U6XB89_9PEZI|nr:hypothetical protein CTA1_3937 [Colletotrichum tanaceti]
MEFRISPGHRESPPLLFRQRITSMSQLSLSRLVEYKMPSTIVLSPSTEGHKPHPKPRPDPPVPVPDNPDDRRNA